MIDPNTAGQFGLVVLPFVLAAWFIRSVIVRGSFNRQIAAMESRALGAEQELAALGALYVDTSRDLLDAQRTLIDERAARSRTDDAKLWAAVAERMPERIRPMPGWPVEALADLVEAVDGDLAKVTFFVFAARPITPPEGDAYPTRPSLLLEFLTSHVPPIAFWADGRASNMQPDPPSDDWVEGRVASRVSGLTKGLIADLAKAKAGRSNPAGGIPDRRDVAAIDGGSPA